MAKRNYSNATLKKLFSLSGNQCASFDCKKEIITKNDDVFGLICHINGLNEKSARFNPDLSEEELNDYENLILLCPNHHSEIDLDEQKFTVEFLKKMKKDHEDKFRNKPFDISEKMLNIINNYFQTQNLDFSGTGNQIVTQSGNITVGITSISEVKDLVLTLFNENFPKLIKIADNAARENIKRFEKTFVNTINTKLKPDDLKKFSDPDVQYVLTQAVLQAGRKNEQELRENLSNLIVERINNSDNELRKIAYNEAIETIGKITPDGIKIIALCFITRYARWNNIKTINDLNEKIKTILPLCDFKNTNAEFQHIVYTGCGELGIGTWNYIKGIRESYDEISPLITANQPLESLNVPQEVIDELFLKINDKEYRFKIINKKNFSEVVQTFSIPEPQKNSLISLFSTSETKSVKKIEELAMKSNQIQKLHILIRDSSLANLSLTSVGIVIGAMFYEKITNDKTSIDIWIN